MRQLVGLYGEGRGGGREGGPTFSTVDRRSVRPMRKEAAAAIVAERTTIAVPLTNPKR